MTLWTLVFPESDMLIASSEMNSRCVGFPTGKQELVDMLLLGAGQSDS